MCTVLFIFFLCGVQVLSSHLMHSSLPGLTRLEQMFLVALADTVATTSAEVTSSNDQKYSGTMGQSISSDRSTCSEVKRILKYLCLFLTSTVGADEADGCGVCLRWGGSG